MPKISKCRIYFNKIDRLSAQCKSCGSVIKTACGTTSGLWAHMRARHSDLLEDTQEFLFGSPTNNKKVRHSIDKRTFRSSSKFCIENDLSSESETTFEGSSSLRSIDTTTTRLENEQIQENDFNSIDSIKMEVEDDFELIGTSATGEPPLEADLGSHLSKNNKRRPSSTWIYFDKLENQRSQCKMCQCIIKTLSGSTTGMIRHLKSIHPEVLGTMREFVSGSRKRRRVGASPFGDGAPGRKQSSTWIYFDKLDIHRAQCKLCQSILKTANMLNHLRAVHPETQIDAENFEFVSCSIPGSEPQAHYYDQNPFGENGLIHSENFPNVKIAENDDENLSDIDEPSREDRDESGASVCSADEDDPCSLDINQPSKSTDDFESNNFSGQMYEDNDESSAAENDEGPQARSQLRRLRNLLKFFSRGNLPLSANYGPGFENIISLLEPKIDKRSMIALAKQKDNSLYEGIKTAILSNFEMDLARLQGISFTTSLWSSSGDDDDAPIQTITVHYISEDFQLKRYLAGWTPYFGPPTEKVIKANLDGLISFLDLNKRTYRWCANDYESKIVLDPSNSEQINSEMVCTNQKINLLVRDAIEKTKVFKSVMKKCEALANHLRKNLSIERMMSDKCKELGVIYMPITEPTSDTWQTRLQLMTSVSKMKRPLEAVTNYVEDLLPSPEEFTTLERCLPLLQKFTEMSRCLSSRKGPTLNEVTVQLYNITQTLEDASVLDEELSSQLLEGVRAQFPNFGTDVNEIAIAHLLDPNFKGIVLRKLKKLEDTKELLRTLELKTSTQERGSTRSDQSNPIEILLKGYIDDGTVVQVKSGLDEEFECYLRTAHSKKSKNILDWWKENKLRYPLLSKLARKYLCIPVASKHDAN